MTLFTFLVGAYKNSTQNQEKTVETFMVDPSCISDKYPDGAGAFCAKPLIFMMYHHFMPSKENSIF